MNNTLRQIELNEIIVYTKHTYSDQTLKKCIEIFDRLVLKLKMKGNFGDDKWSGFSGLKYFGLSFTIDDVLYKEHIGNEFGISKDTMVSMLKCYAIFCSGAFIYRTIAKERINVVKKFLQCYPDKNYRVRHEEKLTIEEFLGFINTPNQQIESIINCIRLQLKTDNSQRKLKPIINYMVIENEINNLYSTNLNKETFIKWFPLFFWVNITFILPLRATEMLVTPLNCIERKNNKVFLNIRRTMLKKGRRTVYYDVDRDYKFFTYEIPDTSVVRIIEKYINITSQEDRRFLFVYNEFMVNDMLSLSSFNNLIVAFMEEYIFGNHRYDFTRYATNIKEFETVTAGDSRPIAMANIYFQDAGEDICRQLADHTNISTSSGYFSNVTEIIFNSSIMQLQKRINIQDESMTDDYIMSSNLTLNIDRPICKSGKNDFDDDCKKQGHMYECMGCDYYIPTQKKLDEFLDEQKKKAEESANRVLEFMNNALKIKNRELTLEEIFLKVQTDATRYRMGCDIKAKEIQKEWQKHRSFQKTFY